MGKNEWKNKFEILINLHLIGNKFNYCTVERRKVVTTRRWKKIIIINSISWLLNISLDRRAMQKMKNNEQNDGVESSSSSKKFFSDFLLYSIAHTFIFLRNVFYFISYFFSFSSFHPLASHHSRSYIRSLLHNVFRLIIFVVDGKTFNLKASLLHPSYVCMYIYGFFILTSLFFLSPFRSHSLTHSLW
jgi:hypothetical protein